MTGMSKVAACAVALLCVAITVAYIANGGARGPSDPNNESEAKAQCEGFADKRLKAPASADYDLSASQDGTTWTVTGTVDAENSFGAQIRESVTCVLHFEGDTAYLDDISIQ